MCISATSPEDSPIGSIPEHRFSNAIETNLADYWLALGNNPNGQIHQSDAIRWAYSGGSFFNRVVLAKLDDQIVDRYINDVVRSFQRRRAAVAWLTGPTTEPKDLGDRLEQRGFSRYEDWLGMAHRLDNLDNLPDLPDGMTVREVKDPEARRAWGDVVCASFELPQSACDLLLQGLGETTSKDGCSWHHNLAYQQGVPVAASTLFMSRGIAGIYLVSTVPQARNQGLGTAMTCLALRQASEFGCNLAVLHATEAGQRIYERIGFRHFCDIGVYRLAAPSPMWKRLAGGVVGRVRNWRRFSQPQPFSGDHGQEAGDLHSIAR